MLSIAGWKSRANRSISSVEFQQVETSQGIIWWERPQEASVLYHCGSKSVVDFFTMYANLGNWTPSQFQLHQKVMCLPLSMLSVLVGYSTQSLPFLHLSSIMNVNPLVQWWIIIIIIISTLLNLVCFLLFNIKSLCQAGKCLSCLAPSQHCSFLAFGMSNFLIITFAVMLRICRKHLVWLDTPGKSRKHRLSCSIMVSLLEVLWAVTPKIILKRWASVIIHLISHSDLILNAKSSRTLTNASARFKPVCCDLGTLTMLRSITSGLPLCLRCTVMATYALWFGEVHASVAKLNFPSYSYLLRWVTEAHLLSLTNL